MSLDEAGASAAAPRKHRERGARIRRLRASHTYFAVLGAIVAVITFTLIAPDSAWAHSVLVCLEGITLLIAAWTTGLVSQARSIFTTVILLCAPVAAVSVIVQGSGSAGASWLAATALLVGTVVVMVVGVFDQNAVNRQSVLGAICAYLLVGMIFAQLYAAVAALGSDDLFAQGTDGSPAIRTYFSFVTLATLGYGDYTPGTDLGRTLAVCEALAGQIYLVTVVALLVSRIGTRRNPEDA